MAAYSGGIPLRLTKCLATGQPPLLDSGLSYSRIKPVRVQAGEFSNVKRGATGYTVHARGNRLFATNRQYFSWGMPRPKPDSADLGFWAQRTNKTAEAHYPSVSMATAQTTGHQCGGLADAGLQLSDGFITGNAFRLKSISVHPQLWSTTADDKACQNPTDPTSDIV